MSFTNIPLNDGHKIIPIAFGSGTIFRDKDATIYVLQAIDAGFHHVDTAQIYRNEQYVGEALRKSNINREDLYVTTKFGIGDVRSAFEASLRNLGLDYVDLYLIHHPKAVAGRLESVWRTMEQIKEEGLAKSIGVSNFKVPELKKLLSFAKVKPALNQVPFHPYNWKQSKELLEFANEHKIVLGAFSSLTPITQMPGGPLDAVLDKLAKRLNATPDQIIFSWVHSKGVVIVTTSTKKSRLEEYLGFIKLRPLTEEEIAEIEDAGTKGGIPDSEYKFPWRPYSLGPAF